MTSRSPLRSWLWANGQPPWFIRLQAKRLAEEADRAAWLAGIQKRLGLLTRDNVDELVATRLTDLGRATWPS